MTKFLRQYDITVTLGTYAESEQEALAIATEQIRQLIEAGPLVNDRCTVEVTCEDGPPIEVA